MIKKFRKKKKIEKKATRTLTIFTQKLWGKKGRDIDINNFLNFFFVELSRILFTLEYMCNVWSLKNLLTL